MRTVTSSDGTTIAYDAIGAGPTLILVGGAMGDRSFKGFVKLAGLLASDFTVVNYDRRGRGDSGDTQPYAVEREVEDLRALIEASGGSAFVWGMSSGGALAVTSAACGLNIEKLAMYDPPYMVDPGGKRPPVDHEEQLKKFIAEDRRNEALKYFFTKCMGAPAVAVSIMRIMPFWSGFKAVANTLPYDAAVMGDFSLPEQKLASIPIPTLVIGGPKQPDIRHMPSVTNSIN